MTVNFAYLHKLRIELNLRRSAGTSYLVTAIVLKSVAKRTVKHPVHIKIQRI